MYDARMSPIMVASRVMFSRLVLPVGLTLVCVWFGWAGTRALTAPGEPNPTPTAPAPAVVLESGTEVLVVLVDSLASAHPLLEGVWVVRVEPGQARTDWLGYRSDAQVDQDELSDYFATGFAISRQVSDGSMFVGTAVRRLSSQALTPSHRVVVDRALLARVVDAAGGVSLGGQEFDGRSLLTAYDAISAGDAGTQLFLQAEILRALSARLAGGQAQAVARLLAESAGPYGADATLIADWIASGSFSGTPELAPTLAP
jgi:hypothetical protein